jgi:hypothetical protein
MILDCIVTACNDNPLYINFIPYFIKSWKLLYPKIDIKIIMINDIIPENFLNYKEYIILFPPIENIPSSFISQNIRLYYPAILNYNNGIMITDIDMIPMNKVYYIENIKNYDNNKFITLRDVLIKDYKEVAMCYNIGINKLWSEIFEINNIDDIKKKIIDSYEIIKNHKKERIWITDQRQLYDNLVKWSKKTGQWIILNILFFYHLILSIDLFFLTI